MESERYPWTTSKSKFPMNDYVLFMIQKTILEVGQSHDFNLTMNTPLITTSICEHCLWKRIGIVWTLYIGKYDKIKVVKQHISVYNPKLELHHHVILGELENIPIGAYCWSLQYYYLW